jgi:hypothetical protein
MSTMPGDGTVDMPSCLGGAASRSPAAETYAIRLPDGQEVEWTALQLADYDGDWHVNLTDGQAYVLMLAIMEDECGND